MVDIFQHKKVTSKVACLWHVGFFFISATPAAQNSPELNIPFLVSNDLLYYISDVSQQAFVLIKNCTKISLKRNSKLSLDQEPLQLHTTLSSSWRLFSKNPIMLVEPTILAWHKKMWPQYIITHSFRY